jgi:hypothetical protein
MNPRDDCIHAMNSFNHFSVSLHSSFACFCIMESLVLGGAVPVMECCEWTVICTLLLAEAKGYNILQRLCLLDIDFREMNRVQRLSVLLSLS